MSATNVQETRYPEVCLCTRNGLILRTAFKGTFQTLAIVCQLWISATENHRLLPLCVNDNQQATRSVDTKKTASLASRPARLAPNSTTCSKGSVTITCFNSSFGCPHLSASTTSSCGRNTECQPDMLRMAWFHFSGSRAKLVAF